MTRLSAGTILSAPAACLFVSSAACSILEDEPCPRDGLNDGGAVFLELQDDLWREQGVLLDAAIVEDGLVTMKWTDIPLEWTGDFVLAASPSSFPDYVFVRIGLGSDTVEFGYIPIDEGRWCTAEDVGRYQLSLEPFRLEKSDGTAIEETVPFERLEQFRDHPSVVTRDRSDYQRSQW